MISSSTLRSPEFIREKSECNRFSFVPNFLLFQFYFSSNLSVNSKYQVYIKYENMNDKKNILRLHLANQPRNFLNNG